LAIAVSLASIAIVAILASKSTGPAIVVNPSGPVVAAGRDVVGPVIVGLDEDKVGERLVQVRKPLDDKLEEILAMTAREKGVEVAPLRAILLKIGEVGVRDEDIARRLDEKANELIKLRTDLAKSKQGPAALASFAQQAEELIRNGDLDDGRDALRAGRTVARAMREQSSGYEVDFLTQEATVDHLQLAYREAAAKYAEAASLMAALDPQKRCEFVLAQADELNSQGDEFGDNSALRSAIEQYKALLDVRPQGRVSLDWAKIQTSLGDAYRALGERENGTALLKQARTDLSCSFAGTDPRQCAAHLGQNASKPRLCPLEDR
jgi:tetratricopeptide (TPR) repeat protein